MVTQHFLWTNIQDISVSTKRNKHGTDLPRPGGKGVPDKMLPSAGLDVLFLKGLTWGLPSPLKREKTSFFADLAIGDRSISLFRIEKKYFAKENHTG